MRLVFIAVISMLALSSHAETSCGLPEELCVAQEAFELSGEQLLQTLAAIDTKIANNEFEDFLVEPAEISDSLQQSQEAWSSYRDAHCDAVFRLMSGGTSRQEDQLNCLTELTQARTAQLQSLYEVTVDRITDDDLSWLNGVWFERCGATQAAFQFYVNSDGVYAAVAPAGDMPSDPGQLAEAEILLARNGFIEVTPFGWDNRFLRIRPADGDRIIGDLMEIFPDSIAPIETIDLVRCSAGRHSDK